MAKLRRLVCRFRGHLPPRPEQRVFDRGLYVELRCPRCKRVRGGHRATRPERRRLARGLGLL